MAGVVVAAHPAAAEAGAGVLASGGSAVDAAVATALALCVVDPANCGLGGYGGFLTYAPPGGVPVGVDFNTYPPDRLDAHGFRLPGDLSEPADGGASIAPPAVVPGLLAPHERFGRLPLDDLVRPAIRLAAEGFTVGADLAGAMAVHWERTGGGNAAFASIFFPHGRPPEAGTILAQPELAGTLELLADGGAAAFTTGPVVDAACEIAQADGGFLERDDFRAETVAVGPAGSAAFESAAICGPPRETSGAGVLLAALEQIDPERLGANRSASYVEELARALGAAWQRRTEAARAALQARHTSSLCTADADGGLVALTFTHGSLFFGSGLVAPGTGVVLNAGANLFATTGDGPRAVTNMCPIVVQAADGTRHALGGTGGPRIPGILLTAVVDVVHYGSTLSASLAAPHLSVRPLDGVLEAEPELLRVAGAGQVLGSGDFGPASGITRTADALEPAVDPRFDSGVAFPA
jgi:gamma-glutamyltranspeptidase / glutathione hydrolase